MSIPKKTQPRKKTYTERADDFLNLLTVPVKDGMGIKIKTVFDVDIDEPVESSKYPSSVFNVSVKHMHWDRAIPFTVALHEPKTLKFTTGKWSYTVRLPMSDTRLVRKRLVDKALEIYNATLLDISSDMDPDNRLHFGVYTKAGERLTQTQINVYLDVLNGDTPEDMVPSVFANKLAQQKLGVPESLKQYVESSRLSSTLIGMLDDFEEAARALGQCSGAVGRATCKTRLASVRRNLVEYLSGLENK